MQDRDRDPDAWSSSLEAAVFHGQLEIVKRTGAGPARDDFGELPRWAAMGGSPEAIRHLVGLGADPNRRGPDRLRGPICGRWRRRTGSGKADLELWPSVVETSAASASTPSGKQCCGVSAMPKRPTAGLGAIRVASDRLIGNTSS